MEKLWDLGIGILLQVWGFWEPRNLKYLGLRVYGIKGFGIGI